MRRFPATALALTAALAACATPPAAPPPEPAPAAAPAAPSPLPVPTRGDGPPALAAETPLSRVAIAGGLDPERPIPLLGAVAAARPDLLVLAGEPRTAAVADDPQLRALREAYGVLSMNAHFASLNMATPMLATCGPSASQPGAGPLSEQLFDAFWRDAAAGRGRPGLHDARIYGPPGRRVQLLLLDSCRSDLGDAQWAGVEEELRRPAEIRLLVSPAPGAGGWAAAERARLAAVLRRTAARDVVLVTTGAAAGPLRPGAPSGLREAAAASLNEGEPEAAFVLVEIDWARRRLILSRRTEAGAAVKQDLPFSAGGPAR